MSYKSSSGIFFEGPSMHHRDRQRAKMGDLLIKVKVDFRPDEPITHMVAGSNQVVFATKDKKVFKIDTKSGCQTDCDLARALGNRINQARIYKIFLDPLGIFTLISSVYVADNQPMDNLLYIKRIQSVSPLKGHLISAVAWNYPKTNRDRLFNDKASDDTISSGTVLLGTSKGLIFQAEFVHSDESRFFGVQRTSKQYVKQIFSLNNELGPITGLEYHQIAAETTSEKTFIIFVSTNSRLYRMIGSVPADIDPPPLDQIFAQNSANYRDVPGRFSNSKLDFHYSSFNSPPIRYAWLTEPGVMTGDIANRYLVDKVIFESSKDVCTIPYDSSKYNDEDQTLPPSTPSGLSPPFSKLASYFQDKPISLAVTNFHVIFLFRASLKAICILNNATVYEECFMSQEDGAIQGMSKDYATNTIWVYLERAVYRYKISDENRNVWKIYLDQGEFTLARRYSMKNESNYDRVICEEAQHYFRTGQYELSAEIFAESKKSFEEVSLMFMEIKCMQALKKYLVIKLGQYESSQNLQFTMTLAWLFEIIISSLSVKKTLPIRDRTNSELAALNTELDQLLSNQQVIEYITHYSDLFYGIILNYSDLETFVRLAELIGDHKHVIEYYIDIDHLDRAIGIMRNVKKDEYFYNYGHIFMKKMPSKLVDALIEQPTIDPAKLIPVLIQENLYYQKCSETIRYLEFCINDLKTTSKVIYKYLFELYARHKDEDTLIEFLENQMQADGVNKCYLELQVCLRLCTELKLWRTCVVLYSTMGLHDIALELALEFDITAAKSIANKTDSEEHQKRLWLTIAKNVLTKNLDIQIATGLLRECRLLRIEDILPFFPDYTTIDFFKEAITQSLLEYRNQILTLKDGTYEKIADDIRTEIRVFKGRYSVIKFGQRCEICSRNLLSRAFYVFPCGHLFHNDCLIREAMTEEPNHNGIDEKLKQLTLESKSSPMLRQQNFMISSTSSQSKSNLDNNERLETELDQLISKECLYCGSVLSDHIDRPPFLKTNIDFDK